VELRQLEAFVAVASELHFGRAADRLHLAQPTLSELVRRLERELGTPLFDRTTRRVALTGAGVELLGRAKVILDDVASATAAVRRMAHGDAGSVLMGITPPVATILAPHLRDAMTAEAPEVELVVQRMWLPDLVRSVAEGSIDVALTCGLIPQADGVVGEVFCGERLLVSLRKDHRLAARDTVTLADLAHDVLGVPSDSLFPAWALAQRQALATAAITPPSVVLAATDLAAATWTAQPEIEWVLMTRSVLAAAPGTVAVPVTPEQLVPYTLQWNPDRARTAAVARFVRLVLTADVPPGWHSQPGHLRHPT
jgi:DNA-binding transcriptional LysR family regulator